MKRVSSDPVQGKHYPPQRRVLQTRRKAVPGSVQLAGKPSKHAQPVQNTPRPSRQGWIPPPRRADGQAVPGILRNPSRRIRRPARDRPSPARLARPVQPRKPSSRTGGPSRAGRTGRPTPWTGPSSGTAHRRRDGRGDGYTPETVRITRPH